MRRRALLATVGTLAGCSGAPRVSDPTPETEPTSSEPEPTAASDPEPRCPPTLDADTTVRCTDPDTRSPVRMTVSSQSLDLPRDSTRFTLHNESETRLRSSVSADLLFVYTGDGWEFIMVKGGSGFARGVELLPGETREWTLRVNTADLGSLLPERTYDYQSFVFRLPPGTYAFGFGVTADGSDTRQMYATTFTVSGDAPPLVPSDQVETHTRRGNTLTVRTQTAKEDEDDARRVSLVMERRSTARRAASLSLFELYNPAYEQVPGYDTAFVRPRIAKLLRDAFAFVNSADQRVRVQTVGTARPPLRLGTNESQLVRYGGTTWELSVQGGWE